MPFLQRPVPVTTAAGSSHHGELPPRLTCKLSFLMLINSFSTRCLVFGKYIHNIGICRCIGSTAFEIRSSWFAPRDMEVLQKIAVWQESRSWSLWCGDSASGGASGAALHRQEMHDFGGTHFSIEIEALCWKLVRQKNIFLLRSLIGILHLM